MSFFYILRRTAFLALITIFSIASEHPEARVKAPASKAADNKASFEKASAAPQGEISESIPFAGLLRVTKSLEFDDDDSVLIDLTPAEGRNLLPVRFLLNKLNDTTFYISASRENTYFNFGEQATAVLKDGKLGFLRTNYKIAYKPFTIRLDARYSGDSLNGTFSITSEENGGGNQGELSMAVAEASEESQFNGAFAGSYKITSETGDTVYNKWLKWELGFLLTSADQALIQTRGLGAFAFIPKRYFKMSGAAGNTDVTDDDTANEVAYGDDTHGFLKEHLLPGRYKNQQGDGTYYVAGYFVNKTIGNSFHITIDDTVLIQTGEVDNPYINKIQRFDFTRSGNTLKGTVYVKYVNLYPDTPKVSEIWADYTGTLRDEPLSFLKVEIKPNDNADIDTFKCGQSAVLSISLIDEFNKVYKDYKGNVVLTLPENQNTAGLTSLPSSQSLALNSGAIQPLTVTTPKEPFDAKRPILNDASSDNTALSGDVSLKVQLENSAIPAVVKKFKVYSPFDFCIDRIEINQGVPKTDKQVTLEFKPGSMKTYEPLPFITEHNALVQIYVGIKNKTSVPFSYIRLKDIKAELKIYKDDVIVKEFQLEKSDPAGNKEYLYKDEYEENDFSAFQDAFSVLIKNKSAEANKDFVISAPGTYKFTASLKLPDAIREYEDEKANNELSLNAPFVQTKPFRVLSCYGIRADEGADAVSSDLKEFFKNSWILLKDLYPVQASKVITNTQPNAYRLSWRKFWEINGILNRYNKENPENQRDYLAVFVSPSLASEYCGDASGCIQKFGGNSAVVGMSFVSNEVKTLAHELGHALGLYETYGDGWVLDHLRLYFSPNPRRSDADFTGNRVEDGCLNFMEWIKTAPSKNYRDFMGLSNTGLANSFVDRVTWDHLYNKHFRLGSSLSENARIASKITEKAYSEKLKEGNEYAENGYVAVSGYADSTGTGSFQPFITLARVPYISEPENGGYFIEFQNSSGTVLNSHNFNVEFVMPNVGPRKEMYFSHYLPLPEGTGKIILKKGSSELASRTITQNAPTVQITSPVDGEMIKGMKEITWTSYDKDGDVLSYDILYSEDGKTQDVLAVNVGTTSYNWNSALSAASQGTGKISVIASDGFNESRSVVENLSVDSQVGLVEEEGLLPVNYSLRQNFPNPFNPNTTIRFDLPEESRVSIRIYDILGRLIRTLTDENYRAGTHDISWRGEDENGAKMGSGCYFIDMTAGGFRQVNKAILLK